MTLNEEELYEQFKMFEQLLRKQTDEWQCKTTEEKWLSIF